jgi:hypothetical protein
MMWAENDKKNAPKISRSVSAIGLIPVGAQKVRRFRVTPSPWGSSFWIIYLRNALLPERM